GGGSGSGISHGSGGTRGGIVGDEDRWSGGDLASARKGRSSGGGGGIGSLNGSFEGGTSGRDGGGEDGDAEGHAASLSEFCAAQREHRRSMERYLRHFYESARAAVLRACE
ncbi:unnamed protein product, partial [Phaeothamnion confervicola]